MYRYGDGTPFPLDENFIETLTAAVEACTAAFTPLTALDTRRDAARTAKADADHEIGRLNDLDKAIASAIAPFLAPDKKSGAHLLGVAQKTVQSAKALIAQARGQLDGRVQSLDAQAAAATASDAVLAALRPFFDNHQLPNAKWIMGWDARGGEALADAVVASGRLQATFKLSVEGNKQPIRVDQLADAVIVHMMKKGLLGRAKPAPIELGKYFMVAFEKTVHENVITLREKTDKASQGLKFAVNEHGATWQTMGVSGEAETDPNPLDAEDVDGIRRLGEGAVKAFKDLTQKRLLVDLSLGGQPLGKLPEPRVVPMEVLTQLTPLARTIRERSRMSGELVLKRDVAGGRREELFVPRAALAQHFVRLPAEYRKPFEDMGISSEDTQPAIAMPRPPAKPSSPPPVGSSTAQAAAVPPPPPGAGPNMPTIRVTTPDQQKTIVHRPSDRDLTNTGDDE